MNKMAINVGYFARIDNDILAREQDFINGLLRNDSFDSDSLYLFNDVGLLKKINPSANPNYYTTEIDGFWVLVPRRKSV